MHLLELTGVMISIRQVCVTFHTFEVRSTWVYGLARHQKASWDK